MYICRQNNINNNNKKPTKPYEHKTTTVLVCPLSDDGHHPGISTEFIIRKTKRFAIPERAVYFLKTKRTAGVLPHPKNFRPAYAGIHIMQERSPDTIRTPFFSFCRFAPAFRASRYAASLNALYAATLCALTSLPRKARREPTFAFAFEASLFAFAFETPPFAFALLYPR